MKKKLFLPLFIIILFCGATFANADNAELPRVAVYVTGDNVPRENKDALGVFILDALVNSGLYRTIERSEMFLDAVEQEHIRQRSGAIDDNQIIPLGRQAGAQFLCVANITHALSGNQISARIIDVKTADVVASGVTNNPLKTLDDLKIASATVVYNMIGVRVKTNENFELLTDKEKTALEQSIQQTVQETMRTKQPYRTSFWIALSFDAIGAGFLGYGIYQDLELAKYNDLSGDGGYWESNPAKGKEIQKKRLIGYVAAGAAVLTGISIHIFF